MHGQAATSAALAAPRVPLPSTRRHRAPNGRFGRSFAKALTIALLMLLGAVWLVPAVLVPLVLTYGIWVMFLPAMAKPVADRHWPADRRALALAGLVVAVGIGALLLVQHPLHRVLWSPVWVLGSLLLYRGLGRGSDSVVPRLLAVPLLAAALLWVDLLLSLQSISVHPAPWAHFAPFEVFAGWPFPGYLGTVPGGKSEAPGLSAMLWRNYLILLGLAALALAVPRWRSPTFLALWLPRLCCGLAAAELFGGIRLFLAIEG